MNNHFTDGMNDDELRIAGCDTFGRAIDFFKTYNAQDTSDVMLMYIPGENGSQSRARADLYFSSGINYLTKNKIGSFIRSESTGKHRTRSLMLTAGQLRKLQRKLANATK